MRPQDGRKDLALDDAIAAVRDDAPAPGAAPEAAARVWQRLGPEGRATADAPEAIGGCADVIALRNAFRSGQLTPARTLLVEDHLRECVGCRAAYLEPGGRHLALLTWRPSAGPLAAAPRPWRSYARAASVLLAVAVTAWVVQQAFFGVPAGSRAAVQSVSGGLQRVAASDVVALAPGQEIGEAEPVRTARASRAVLRLFDGSLVEMGERAELFVTARGKDTTIHLARGQIIVQAAKRRTGHLRVASGEATVSVTGTVFTVNHGLKGSRVSVFEGQVKVASAGGQKVLAPGDQWASSAGMEPVPLKDEIAWSADVDRHLALLAEVKVLRDRLRAVPTPGLRYVSRLLPLVPAEAVLFASAPNYGEALAEAGKVFEERLGESAVLRDWWAQVDPARHGGPDLGALLDRVRTFSQFLGDEVVFAIVADDGDVAHHRVRPIVMAEVRQPGLREFLEGELARVPATPGHHRPIVIVGEGDTASADVREGDLFILVRSGLVAISMDRAELRRLAARFDAAPAGGLDTTPFGARIAESYGDGVGILFAADFQRMTTRVAAPEMSTLRASGLDGLRYLVFERKQVADDAQHPGRARLRRRAARDRLLAGRAGADGRARVRLPVRGAGGGGRREEPGPHLRRPRGHGHGRRREGRPRAGRVRVEGRRADPRGPGGDPRRRARARPRRTRSCPRPRGRRSSEVNDPARLQLSIERLVSRAGEVAAPRGRPPARPRVRDAATASSTT